MSKRKKRPSLNERFRRKTERKKERRQNMVDALMKLAGEPVPDGSGLVVYGDGPFRYVKTNRSDGSTRIFCFHSRADVHRAMGEGVAADHLTEMVTARSQGAPLVLN